MDKLIRRNAMRIFVRLKGRDPHSQLFQKLKVSWQNKAPFLTERGGPLGAIGVVKEIAAPALMELGLDSAEVDWGSLVAHTYQAIILHERISAPRRSSAGESRQDILKGETE